MKRYDIIAFDLDGTLTDPERGLIEGFVYAFRKMGIDYGKRQELRRFIGPSLFYEWQREFGFDETEVRRAIDIFREYYNIYGWRENEVYPGIRDMLRELLKRGKRLIVATSKPEPTAKKVLCHFGLDKYFEFIGGASLDPSRDEKHKVLRYSLENSGVTDLSKCLMVGDRRFDAEGAAAVGIDSVGVLWGHGTREELLSASFVDVVSTPQELTDLLK